MKTLILFAAIASFAAAKEELRMWTDPTGRMIRGTLQSKTDSTATLALDTGKTVTIPLEKLSKDDQEYVSKADLARPPKMTVATVSAQKGDTTKTTRYDSRTRTYDTKTKESGDSRTISVKVSDTAGKVFEIQVLWIGDDGNKSDYGVYKKLSKDITADGETKFSADFNATSAKYDGSYRGYAVRLLDADGNEISRQASQKPFERFLDAGDVVK